MKRASYRYVRLMTAAVAMILAAGSAHGQESSAGAAVLLAQGSPDCYAIGQRVAAERGGELARATAETRGGETVCRIVVLVPGGDGERPRRAEVIVPAG